MKFLNDYWGINENISSIEIAERSAVMFLIAILLIKMSGMRPFGKGDDFDKIMSILMGAILSRGVVGATPFIPTVVSVTVIILIHKLFSKISLYNKWFGKIVKGEPVLLYSNGKFIKGNMNSSNLSEHDVLEELRYECQHESLEKIEKVFMERTGKISFLKNDDV